MTHIHSTKLSPLTHGFFSINVFQNEEKFDVELLLNLFQPLLLSKYLK